MLIVLLAGWSGSGKDTVAAQLVSEFGFERFAFADPVKVDVASAQQIPLEWLHDPERKRPYREYLIGYGEAMRASDPEVWARRISADILRSLAQGQRRFVISDWRHLSELWGIQRYLPAAIVVPVLVRRSSQLVSPVPDATEYGLLGFPFAYTIRNASTLDILSDHVRELVYEVCSKFRNASQQE